MSEDLLQFTSDDGILLDVGWYPHSDPSGEYGATVIAEEDWHRPLAEFATREVQKLVAYIEDVLAHPPQFPIERIVQRLKGGVSETRAAAAEALAQRFAVEAIEPISAAMRAEEIPAAYDRMEKARGKLVAVKMSREAK